MFEEKDLIHYNGFKKLVNEGDFELKGGSVITAALLIQWFNELGIKIKDNIESSNEDKALKVNKNKKVSKKEI